MAVEQVRQSLERADESLRCAIAQLVEMRFGAPDYLAALNNAAQHLRSATAGAGPVVETQTLKPIVQRLRTSAARVQALLDSAAAFYCGWTSATPAGPDTYAPDGQLQRDGSAGRMVLNA